MKPFAAVAATVNPVVGAALMAVNLFLPEEDRLPVDATGQQVTDAVGRLPSAQRGSLMERQIDLAIAEEESWATRYKAMVEADGQSTRPRIAWAMARLLVAEILCFTVLLFYITATEGLSAVMDGSLWTVFGILTAPPAGILGKYFGELRREQGNRLGAPPTGIAAMFGGKS